MRKKLPMTAWYDPALLVQTGIRVAISTVFGQFADRREAMAAANAIEPQPLDASFRYDDRAGDGEFWIDFLADTGDGWAPTFAMAQLVTERELKPEGAAETLKRGRVLILGGDQVYPTASQQAYEERFLNPFDEAFERASEESKRDMPDLYAIPGNHDWYDGLSAFFALFCRRRIAIAGSLGMERGGRPIAGRQTNQTRSYFALKLPGDWWLWGTDSQLEGYIDQPQIEYFQHVAAYWMAPGSKVILCVGEPSWAYVDPHRPERKFETFSYLERLAGMARLPEDRAREAEDWPQAGEDMAHRLKVVLTGDSHHYARYVESDRHYVTCGGGGAFLHPTHQLENKEFKWDYPPPGEQGPRLEKGYPRRFDIAGVAGADRKALFPDAATSRGLTKGNWRFAIDNPGMTLVFFGAYAIYNWVLNMSARIEGHVSLVHALAGNGSGPLWDAPLNYVALSFVSPLSPLLFLAALGGYYYFADSPHDSARRLAIGLGHCLVQAGAAILVTSATIWLLSSAYFDTPEWQPLWLMRALIIGVATAAAAIVSATIFGLYLWYSLNRRNRHWNEAFSSLAIAGYKAFLRMWIDGDGMLHLYPIGLEEVPAGGGDPASLKTHLIEPPIAIS